MSSEASPGESEDEYLSDVLPIDLTRFGVLPTLSAMTAPSVGSLGADLAGIFDTENTDSDFTIRTLKDEAAEGDEFDASTPWGRHALSTPTTTPGSLPPEHLLAPPIKVHTLILLSRWPHFRTLMSSNMSEFHTSTLYLPEPYSVTRAFLSYLYTDSLPVPTTPTTTVASLLVLSSLYNLPRLKSLCLSRLYSELDVESAAVIWEKAGLAGEWGLKERARGACERWWGRVVRTKGMRGLGRESLLGLVGECAVGARVVEGGEGGVQEEGGAMGIEYGEEDEEMG